uniref:Cytochrome b n=1 Tax=Leptomyrmex pallens TaxID=611136 RepID=V5JF27_9HYME|nr:cytochrome b [Leptomyrmex pallens]AGL61402.1 cytochrome b [Leptomyrmex pallens]
MKKLSFMYLPTPVNISYWWNFGSLLGMFLVVQIISGFMLSMHYCPNINLAFNSIIHMIQNVNKGWLFHNIHINGASFFFISLYLHMGRGMYYSSPKLTKTWLMGSIIFMISMATAFLGYVLPWGQMSYWGATVITNLLSAIPTMGPLLVKWVWGGFSINNATLNRFYSLHFILPFMIILMVLLHLYFLHETGSSNPLGLNSNFNKLPFHIYFTIKDMFVFILMFMFLMTFVLIYPYSMTDPDNFSPANPMSTPTHIQPEWYFLFAYSMLRSIPNKLGGVITLVLAILILMTMPLNKKKMNSFFNYPASQIFLWLFTNNFLLLTWLGAQPIEVPFNWLGQLSSILYFSYFLTTPLMSKLWDLIMFYTPTSPPLP